MTAFGPLFGEHFNSSSSHRQAKIDDHQLHLDPHSPHQRLLPGWKWRLAPLVCVCCLVLSVLAGRLWQLQVINGATYLKASQNNSLTLKTIPAPRGIIYDQNGQVLARNLPSFSLAVTPANLPKSSTDQQSVIKRVAQLSGLSVAKIEQDISQAMINPVLPTALKSNLDRDTEIALMAAQDTLPGFSVEEDLVRSYPMGNAFSHILGYTGSISTHQLSESAFTQYHPGEEVGKSGLEQFYESQLHGKLGEKLSQVNAQGASQSHQTEQSPVPGYNLTLSLDSALQQQATQVLQAAMDKYHTTGAVGVFQDPNTGQVLSLVSLPSFDNNLFAQGITNTEYQKLTNNPLRPLFDRSIAGSYPPGSLVKPLLGGGAVADGTITPSTIINSPSYITSGTYRYADWTYWVGQAAPGPINVIQAIAQSCDTFFYQLGGGYEQVKGMGVQAIKHYYSQAGFGSLAGIDLPGEAAGVVPDPAWKATNIPSDPGWYLGNTYQLAIGQSYLLTTPLQINDMTSAIANGGTLYQPQLVNQVTDDQGNQIKGFAKNVIRTNIVPKSGLAIAQEGMRQAVTIGIVYPFRTNPWPVAAKTGTAEFGTQNTLGQYQTHSWVTGYAPANKPKISFTVLLESGGSSTNAAQVANDIITWYAQQHP
jgi:penicillin-binding protein 2